MKTTTRTLTSKTGVFKEREGVLFFFRISRHLAKRDLLAILRRQKDAPYFDNVCAAIALHPATDAYVSRRILHLCHNSFDAQNTVATSARTGPAVLKTLRRSQYESVREHVRMAMVVREVTHSRHPGFDQILNRNRGANGIALGVQYFIARHKRTPTRILSRLASESPWDEVVDHARKRLNAHGKK